MRECVGADSFCKLLHFPHEFCVKPPPQKYYLIRLKFQIVLPHRLHGLSIAYVGILLHTDREGIAPLMGPHYLSYKVSRRGNHIVVST